MRLREKIQVAISIVALAGPLQAEPIYMVPGVGAPGVPFVMPNAAPLASSGISVPASLINILDLPSAAEGRQAIARMTSLAALRVSTPDLVRVAELAATVEGGAELYGPGVAAVSWSNPASGELVAIAIPAARPARAHEAAMKPTERRPSPQLLAMPEPSGWALLLCSVLVVGFMALRKTRHLAS